MTDDASPPLLPTPDAWNGEGVLSIIGPTGSGKTAAALAWIQKKFPGDRWRTLLVSVDAVAVWRGFDIGSAKPAGAEREGYEWAGLDFLDPREETNAARFVTEVRPRILDAVEAGRPVVCVGGSHFYEQALVKGQSVGEASDVEYQRALDCVPNGELRVRLLAYDPRFAAKAHLNDRYRLTRFLDLAQRQGLGYDALFTEPKKDGLYPSIPVFRFVQGNHLDGDALAKRLAVRIDAMLSAGWLEEIGDLLAADVPPDAPAFRSVGYRELLAHVQGRLSLAQARELTLTAHLQLAKKQGTWIRGLRKK